MNFEQLEQYYKNKIGSWVKVDYKPVVSFSSGLTYSRSKGETTHVLYLKISDVSSVGPSPGFLKFHYSTCISKRTHKLFPKDYEVLSDGSFLFSYSCDILDVKNISPTMKLAIKSIFSSSG